MGPDALAHVLRPLAGLFGMGSGELLVGLDHADDAAVYRINENQAIVATTDFFPPIVDDPYQFGAIAAANALSDIYAMGADPLFCLNLVGFPDTLEPEILSEILHGGADKVREAGAMVAGGHTVTDHEPKYGLVAIGMAHPERIFTKGGARPGDTLILTKPIGTGVVTTALKQQHVVAADLDVAVQSMLRLNGTASKILREFSPAIHACTDITGFGLLGHAWEMAEQSAVRFNLHLDDIPILAGAREYAAAGYTPGGTDRNASYLAPHVSFGERVSTAERLLLFDPQTSGGLFVAVDADQVKSVLESFAAHDVPCFVVGSVVEGEGLIVE